MTTNTMDQKITEYLAKANTTTLGKKYLGLALDLMVTRSELMEKNL